MYSTGVITTSDRTITSHGRTSISVSLGVLARTSITISPSGYARPYIPLSGRARPSLNLAIRLSDEHGKCSRALHPACSSAPTSRFPGGMVSPPGLIWSLDLVGRCTESRLGSWGYVGNGSSLINVSGSRAEEDFRISDPRRHCSVFCP